MHPSPRAQQHPNEIKAHTAAMSKKHVHRFITTIGFISAFLA
ncbi:hypothetical protein GCM10011391_24310 [Pullulanibacillus camelliae]|uniref:Uncharacterized protein n=1 Tax=Pullulanibacillus camelliae TaxID=1707096 RepID=A0A8J3DVH4_9BACL|nr:hypothetical protein [Pullulanibacillus camelliae]GGE44630.1 hypothetical protein GCM10011391_24310 [Pullulanibacillus camelliae]